MINSENGWSLIRGCCCQTRPFCLQIGDLLIDIFDFLLDVIVVLAKDFFRSDIRRRRVALSADG